MFYVVGIPEMIYVVSSRFSMMNLINRYNGIADLHRSVYGFKEIVNNGEGQVSVVPQSIAFNKIFFDVDVPDSSQLAGLLTKKYRSIRKCVNFSGKGFHILLSCYDNVDEPKDTLKKAQVEIGEDLGIDLQLNENYSTLGDIRRMYRIPNTWNLKRRRYCIPLREKDLNKEWKDIFKMAKRQRFLLHSERIFGDEFLNLSEMKSNGSTLPIIWMRPVDVEALKKSEDSLKKLGIVNGVLCTIAKKCVRPDAGYSEREKLIIYCRDKLKLRQQECAEVLYNILSRDKFEHCVQHSEVPRLYSKMKDNTWRYKYNFCSRCYEQECKLRWL